MDLNSDSGAENLAPSSPEQSNTESVIDSNTRHESSDQSVARAIADLETMEKFKFNGREMTPKELKAMVMRQEDYTRKTQSLSQERESLNSERKFYENLYADIEHVKNNPQLLSAFLREYPEKFHPYVKRLFQNSESQAQKPAQEQKPQVDYELMSRLQKMESFVTEQETSKNLVMIDKHMDNFSKKYPDALSDQVIARVHDAYLNGEKVDEAAFEKAFKDSDAQMKHLLSTKYQDRIKKQTEANRRGRDVVSGGGTPGRAPQKFKSIAEVTKFAVNSIRNRE